jgi:4-hydroxy-tetrahydrodipicolinate synthase
MAATVEMRGLGVAIATPFGAGGEVDFAAFGGLIDFLVGAPGSSSRSFLAADAPRATGATPSVDLAANFREREGGGCDFLVVLGSTGEAATVEPEERRELIKIAVARSLGVPVVVGTGSNSTAQTIRLTAEAVSLGADAVLVVTPFYNKPTPDGLVAHYSAVAEAAAGKPVVVYNVPGRTGLNLTPAVLARLWKIPGIAALKESSGNLAQIGEIARTLPDGKILLSGDDALALPSIAVGAHGLISVAGNVLPRRVKAMLDAALSGRRDEAIRLHQALLPFMDALFLESNPIPLKASLAFTGLTGDTLRLPLAPASAATRAALAKVLEPFMKASE